LPHQAARWKPNIPLLGSWRFLLPDSLLDSKLNQVVFLRLSMAL